MIDGLRKNAENSAEPATGESLSVVFDLGGVLIDWNPRYLYRRLIDDDAAIERFLASVCTQAWNETFDAGRPFAEGVAELCARHPGHAELIESFDTRWLEMVHGPIDGTVRHLEALALAGTPLFALSNWSAEKFPHVRERYAFFDHFRGIVISGEIGVIKPDPRAFEALLDRAARPAEACLLIDDSETNVHAADRLGFRTILFRDPEQLATALSAHGLPHA